MTRRTALRFGVATAIAVVLFGLALVRLPVITFLARLFLGATVLVVLLWLASRAYQAFLWKVGRRLAFSYFLIGVVPIPMVLLLGAFLAYLLASFFLGHLYRDVATSLERELVAAAEEQLEAFSATGRPGPGRDGTVAFDYYRGGRWVGGAGASPEAWPRWLSEAPGGDRSSGASAGASSGPAETAGNGSRPGSGARPVIHDDEPTLALGVVEGELGVAAVLAGDLAQQLTRETGAWVETSRPGEPGGQPEVVTIQGREMRFRSGTSPFSSRPEEQVAFFADRAGGDGLFDRPVVFWAQRTGPIHDLATGELLDKSGGVHLLSTPRHVFAELFSSAADQDAVAWAGLVVVGGVLASLYAVALTIALAMIFGLSRAVDQLSRATSAVQAGDFTVRMPARRRDQLGALQRSFNQMAENLEALVATSAQKEVLEKELEIARELQESLLPGDLPRGEAVEFATLFEPSAAIGGDYFDILRLDERRLGVVIADVSGHGLSSGLRMAMLKAALQILVDDRCEPATILARLDALVRANREQRFFVTATLAWVDLATGILNLTNAGHPPTYLLRESGVEEVALPSSPLGGLGRNYASHAVELQPGDLAVWLSDGFIEALSPEGEAFGYQRVAEALAGPGSAVAVRGRLLEAVDRHTGPGARPDDDRTLVVMHYRPG